MYLGKKFIGKIQFLELEGDLQVLLDYFLTLEKKPAWILFIFPFREILEYHRVFFFKSKAK